MKSVDPRLMTLPIYRRIVGNLSNFLAVEQMTLWVVKPHVDAIREAIWVDLVLGLSEPARRSDGGATSRPEVALEHENTNENANKEDDHGRI